jgi:hypothetical protein
MTIDLKDFCLNTIMPNCECARVRFKDMPKELAECDDDDDDDSDAIATADDSASDTLRAQPKASRSNAAPAGEGVLIPLHAGHASHATYACMLSQTLE